MASRLGRRDFLAAAGAVATLLACDPALAATGSALAGRKFGDDGRVLPFAGNTIICHLPQQGGEATPFHVLLDAYRALPGHAFAARLTMLPPSSYHMTVFGGANDQQRGGSAWPGDLPLDLPIEECTQVFMERLAGFASGLALPIRMQVDATPPPADDQTIKIRLAPINAAENARLRSLRDRLADLLGVRSADHDSYGFHITLGYVVQSLGPAEAQALRSFERAWSARLQQRCPEIRLGPLEFCSFADMFHFDQRLILR